MSERKSIGKKLRFEVFKRDRFTCQYCGEKAPDVVLHVDHIQPVSKGGKNDILNLITSCVSCNLGKGPNELSDDSAVQKQRSQLEELSERRDQLEAMLEWRDGLRHLDEQAVEHAVLRINEVIAPFSVNENGRANLTKLVRKFGLSVVLEAIDNGMGHYLKYDGEGVTSDSATVAFNKLGGICYYKANPEANTRSKDANYIKAVLRNRLRYVNERMLHSLLTDLVANGADMEAVREFSKVAQSWTAFREGAEDYLEELKDGEN